MKSWAAGLESRVSGQGTNANRHGDHQADSIVTLNCWRGRDERVPFL
jgi:hypothetical protein